jgi:hypothetical protein
MIAPSSVDGPLAALYIACPLTLMKFSLVYDGELTAGRNSRAQNASSIRESFHPQLVKLWDTHLALKRLRHEARIPDAPGHYGFNFNPRADYDSQPTPVPPGFTDLCAPIQENGRGFVPLIRESLGLACAINVLFLRPDRPGAPIVQSGDLDNRIKTLFDALRKPTKDESRLYSPKENPLYCLMESDTLVTDFSIKSDQLLTASTAPRHHVHLIIEVIVKVLHVRMINLALVGD